MRIPIRTAWGARLLALLVAVPAMGQAQFSYAINNGTITITGYSGPSGAVIVPSTINDLAVTGIGSYAFLNHPALTKVTIPDSVTSIGIRAFFQCTSLTNVTIGNSVTNIGN